MTEKEIKAYLNYEDVQRELETAKEIIKELLVVAQGVNDAYNKNIETDLGRTIQQAKQFLLKEQDAAHSFEHDENECEFYLDNESKVYGCECGNIEVGGKTYYPEDKLTRLRSELQQKDEVIRELIPIAESFFDNYPLERVKLVIEKAKLNN